MGGRTVFLQHSSLKVFETKTIFIQAQSFFPLPFPYLPVCKLSVNVEQELENNQDLRGNNNRQLLRAAFLARSLLKSGVWSEKTKKKKPKTNPTQRLSKATVVVDES